MCTGVCQCAVLLWVDRQQLLLWTEPHAVAVGSLQQSHDSCVTDSTKKKKKKTIPECIYTCTCCSLNGFYDSDLVSSQWGKEQEACLLLTLSSSNVDSSMAALSPVEKGFVSFQDSPPLLIDSRCPTGFWTLAERDVPNVHQLPGRQPRALYQQQAGIETRTLL